MIPALIPPPPPPNPNNSPHPHPPPPPPHPTPGLDIFEFNQRIIITRSSISRYIAQPKGNMCASAALRSLSILEPDVSS